MTSVSTTQSARHERVDLILNQLDQLPTLPAIAARILQVTSQAESSAKDVIELIQSDQSLSINIISMVRRASFGAGRSVDTVEKAVVLLGFDAVRHAVLSIKVFETLGALGGVSDSYFDRSEFWKHSLAVACAAHLIAERWPGHVDPEVAFVCGLLHDIGKVALDACLPKSYDRIFRVAHARHACIIDIEQELLGVDHTVAGKRLAQRWQLPNSLLESIWLHHHTPDMLPDTVTNPDLVQIVNLCNTWVHELRLGSCSGFAEPTGSKEIALQMGIPLETLDAVAPLLLEHIRDRAELLGLDNLTPGALYASTVSNANTELGRMSADLIQSTQQLEARSRLIDVVGAFSEKLHSQSTLLDICQSAAAAARQLMHLPAAAVFSRHPNGHVLYAGLSDSRGCVNELITESELDEHSYDWQATAQYSSLVLAPPGTVALRERFGRRLGPAPHWMVAIVKHQEIWGGVLFHADAEDVEHISAALPHVHVFTSVLSLALVNGHEQMRAERLNEGLAHVNRQLKSAQAELLQARSLQAVAEMAAGAAHELNNPLAVIAGRAQMLASATEDEQLAKDSKIIADQALRCSEIVNELMDFAKPANPTARRIALAALLKQLQREWTEKSSLQPDQITLQISDVDIAIYADGEQITQMFEELLRNAFEACDPSGARVIINCHTDIADDRVIVAVEDNGCGMTREILVKARDPFFSHKPAGRGRGLGLSRAFRWCELNGGSMRIESQPDLGTTVIVEFPAAPQA